MDWLNIAENELGVSEIHGKVHSKRILEYHKATSLSATDDETPWCSSFVNWVMGQAGITGTRSARARSWLNWGKSLEKPTAGCIVVLKRGNSPSTGHVGFYMGESKDKIRVLGGNQGDRVSVSLFPKSDVLGYRIPKKEKTK